MIRVILLAFLGLALAIVLLGAGVFLGSRSDLGSAFDRIAPDAAGAEVDGDLFPLQEEVIGALRKHFYKEVDLADVEDEAVRGLLEGLGDEYTTYFDPEEYARFKEHAGGSYSGVGMSVELRGEVVIVITVFKGTPAEQAGIQPGEAIIGVSGESVRGLSLEEVVQKIKGPEGSKVELQVFSPPEDEPLPETLPDLKHLEGSELLRNVELVRREIELPVVETELVETESGRVAHISFLSFSERSSVELRRAVQKAVEQDKAKALVLDLRGNGGGLLSEAVQVASLFIEDGVVVTTEGLHSPKEVFRAQGEAFDEVPLYVLINEFSASASEIVAGALKDTERATVVGETSFGKGLVQQIVPLTNGGALKVTTAVYLTPSGRDINEKGVEPQVEAPDDRSTTEVDETLQRALELVAEG